METITLGQLLEAVGGTLLGEFQDREALIQRVDTDSRNIHEGALFIPLIGEEEVVEIIAAWKRSSGNLALQQFFGHYPLLKSE